MTITPHDRFNIAYAAWQWFEKEIGDCQLELRLTAKCPDAGRVKYLHGRIRHQLMMMHNTNRMAKDCRTKSDDYVDSLLPVYEFEKVIAASFGAYGACLEREASDYIKDRFIRSGLGPPKKNDAP